MPTGLLVTAFRSTELQDRTRTQTARDLALALAASSVFGLCLGAYALDARQVLASALKMPLLLGGTAAVCFPLWYLLQFTEEGTSLIDAIRVQAAALLATACVWAALAPPLLVLILSTQNYTLARGLAVLVGFAGGVVGLARFAALSGAPKKALLIYFTVFGSVGAQLAWILRPFVGSPFDDFMLFRILGA